MVNDLARRRTVAAQLLSIGADGKIGRGQRR
jgi:hypothetical protein